MRNKTGSEFIRYSSCRTAARLAVAAALALFGTVPLHAETAVDAYGNEIQYEADGVTVKYQFWRSPLTAEELSPAGTSVGTFTSPSALEARAWTWISAFANIWSTPWRSTILIIR